MSTVSNGTGPVHEVTLVHLEEDTLCQLKHTPLVDLLAQRLHMVYIKGKPPWMKEPYHNYAYLLDVNMPKGIKDARDSAWTMNYSDHYESGWQRLYALRPGYGLPMR
eukprot:s4405_g2.t1